MNIFRLLRICLLTAEILAASTYVSFRFTRTLSPKHIGRKLTFATVLLFDVLTILGMVFRNCNLGAWYLPFQTIQYTWIILLLCIFLGTLLIDFILLILYFRNGRKNIYKGKNRLLQRSYIILVSISFAFVAYGFFHFSHPTVTKRSFQVSKPVPDWRIVAVSDLHCGTMTKKTLLENVRRINDLHPDLILLLGDQAVINAHDFKARGYADLLGQLQARHGIIAINGNHELIHGYVGKRDAEHTTLFKKMGVTLLEDSAVVVNHQLVVIGRKDTSCVHRAAIGKLVPKDADTLPIIVLDHSPLAPHNTANIADLQLSGHTHNGQVFPVNIWGHLKSRITGSMFHGEYQIGKTHYYVTSGLGGSGAPIRIGTDGEIVIFNLTNQQ